MAGLAHDIGKASPRFQEKLRAALKPKSHEGMADRIRHEWVSTRVLETWRAMQKETDAKVSIEQAWNRVQSMEAYPGFLENEDADGFDPYDEDDNPVSIDNPHAAVDAAVLTHHGLMGPQRSKDADGKTNHAPYKPQSQRHVRSKADYPDQGVQLYDHIFEKQALDPKTEKHLRGMLRRVSQLEGQPDADYWRAVTLLSRVALIAADHEVSKRVFSGNTESVALFANTGRDESGASTILNQPLDYHLEHVGKKAQEWVYRLDRLNLPGLHATTRERLQERAGPGRFQWQDQAVDHLEAHRQEGGPWLLLNNAETGAGKTRANLRALEAMTPDHEPMRASLALNLRSLTLQTHDALKNQLHLGEEELACLIGDSFARAAFDDAREFRADNDEDEDETEAGGFDVIGEGVDHEIPEWLEQWAPGAAEARTRTMLGSPLLVSTIDYLIQCGEPGRQGHHVKAFLRVAGSDLVLDEIDSYEPKALVAVLRVVTLAAMMGRKIVASSATLSSPVAQALVTAFAVGARMNAALMENPEGTKSARVSVVDNRLKPETKPLESVESITSWYGARVNRMMGEVLADTPRRRAFIQSVEVEGADTEEERFQIAVGLAVRQLHGFQKWEHPSGKKVSFGLVRVANVPPCVELTRVLNTKPGLYASSYHSMDIKARRAMKEARLDRLFQRGGERDPLADDPELDRIIREAEEDELTFVVVATPVEEIGRDHDFDWAVIEPSSTQSIVQTAGRVNRHRRNVIDRPNIAILDRNRRSLVKGEGEACFIMPGNGYAYPDADKKRHRMRDLLASAPGWEDDVLTLTAAVHFGLDGQKARFAEMDDKAVERTARTGMEVIEGDEGMNMAWLVMAHYRDFQLRDSDSSVTFELAPRDSAQFEAYRLDRETQALLDDHSFKVEPGQRSWLSWGLSEAKEYAERIGMPRQGMQVEVAEAVANGRSGVAFDEIEGGR